MNRSPENPIPLGQWFNPFVGYDLMPYEINRPDYQVKEVSVLMEGQIKASVATSWINEDFQRITDNPLYYFNGRNGLAIPSLIECLRLEEERIEIRLVEIDVTLEDIMQKDRSDWLCIVRFPNNAILTQISRYLDADDSDINERMRYFINNWLDPISGKVYQEIIMPDTEYMLRQLSFNILRV